MDTSYWKTLNPTLKFVETKSLFYNKYVYKLKLKAPRIRTHVYLKGDIYRIKAFFTRQKTLFQENYLGYNYYDYNLKFNNFIYKRYLESKEIKFRIENPYISLYLNDITDLEQILKVLDTNNYIAYAKEISLPSIKNIQDIIDGKIIVKRIPEEYKFKVIIKGGIYTDDTVQRRENIYNYLYSLGEEVLVPRSFMHSNRYQLSQSYFYCKDEKVVLFVHLMAPELLGKTFSVVKS